MINDDPKISLWSFSWATMIAEILVSVDIPQVSTLQQTIWKYRLHFFFRFSFWTWAWFETDICGIDIWSLRFCMTTIVPPCAFERSRTTKIGLAIRTSWIRTKFERCKQTSWITHQFWFLLQTTHSHQIAIYNRWSYYLLQQHPERRGHHH